MWLVSRPKYPALVAFLMLLLDPGADAEPATITPSQNISAAQITTVAASEGQLPELGTEKLRTEIRKLEAEIASIRAIDAGTRWWTTVLAAIGTIVGAVVGGVFTFVITRMGHRFDRLQKDIEEKRSQRETLKREQDDLLNRLKLRQEREQARDLHNLRLFQDLGHASHRARLAAASVLLDRLRRLERPTGGEEWTPQEIADKSLIKKVLVAVLKRQRSNKSQELQDKEASADAEDSMSEAALRKYIADELVETLGARFASEERPKEFGNSPLGKARDFQECDLTNVYWACVDARRLDFFGSDLTKASLRGAALQEAVFYDATLCDAILRDSDLRKANLMGADLRKADLRDADLRDANLQGADLGGADLRGAKLEGAVINIEALRRFRATQWPEGFAEPKEVGTKIMDDIYRPAS